MSTSGYPSAAAGHRLANTGVDWRDEFARNRAADDLVLEDVSATAFLRRNSTTQ